MTNHHVLPDEAIAATGTIELGYRYDVAGERGEEGRRPAARRQRLRTPHSVGV
jgi:hypothetical protein